MLLVLVNHDWLAVVSNINSSYDYRACNVARAQHCCCPKQLTLSRSVFLDYVFSGFPSAAVASTARSFCLFHTLFLAGLHLLNGAAAAAAWLAGWLASLPKGFT